MQSCFDIKTHISWVKILLLLYAIYQQVLFLGLKELLYL